MHAKIKLLYPESTYRRGSALASAIDLCYYSEEQIAISSGATAMLPTGIAIEMTEGLCGLVLPRSGLGCREGLAPANTPGLIDPDYRGEIYVCLHNHSPKARVIYPREFIAQLLITSYYPPSMLIEVDDLSDTERGEKGFGSSDQENQNAQT